jgi:hypothetical protein
MLVPGASFGKYAERGFIAVAQHPPRLSMFAVREPLTRNSSLSGGALAARIVVAEVLAHAGRFSVASEVPIVFGVTMASRTENTFFAKSIPTVDTMLMGLPLLKRLMSQTNPGTPVPPRDGKVPYIR